MSEATIKNRRSIAVRLVALLPALLIPVGCHGPATPAAVDITDGGQSVVTESLVWRGQAAPPWPPGIWSWSWNHLSAGSDRLSTGDPHRATLVVTSPSRDGTRVLECRWLFVPALPETGLICLIPVDTLVWHDFRIDAAAIDPGVSLPLPRRRVASADFDDLLDLLRHLTRPRFAGRVTHWPDTPVPVQITAAVSGTLNLAACFEAALDIWNNDPAGPWFQAEPSAPWGVRLIHYPDVTLHPPLRAQITRLDDCGRPLRIQILCGNNYDSARDSIYAVRGFVHELAHALFLWGHSPDRNHCLWGAAPPQVMAPATEEREAVLWWHSLPQGMELTNYDVINEP